VAQARQKAAAEGLANVEFRSANAINTGLPDRSFDAVVCVLGVFFAPDMPAFVAEMWQLVRPGGVLAVTTWGPGLLEPANGLFWEAVRDVEPALFKAFNPWDEITTPDALTALLAAGGVVGQAAEAADGQHDLASSEQFWEVVLGTGYRATIEALSPAQRDLVRRRLLTELRSRHVTALRTNVVFATARRQG
jgi:SAM-dependent methyltransferase